MKSRTYPSKDENRSRAIGTDPVDSSYHRYDEEQPSDNEDVDHQQNYSSSYNTSGKKFSDFYYSPPSNGGNHYNNNNNNSTRRSMAASGYNPTTTTTNNASTAMVHIPAYPSDKRLAPTKDMQAQVAIARLVRLASKEEGEYRMDIIAAERIDFNHLYKSFFQDLMILRYYAVEKPAGGGNENGGDTNSSPRSTTNRSSVGGGGGHSTRRSVSPRRSGRSIKLAPIDHRTPEGKKKDGSTNASSSATNQEEEEEGVKGASTTTKKKQKKNLTGTTTLGAGNNARKIVFGARSVETRHQQASSIYGTSAVRILDPKVLKNAHYNHPIPKEHLKALRQREENLALYERSHGVLPETGKRSLALKFILVEESQKRETLVAEEKEWRMWRKDQEALDRAYVLKNSKMLNLLAQSGATSMGGSAALGGTALKQARDNNKKRERIEREEGNDRILLQEEERKDRRVLAKFALVIVKQARRSSEQHASKIVAANTVTAREDVKEESALLMQNLFRSFSARDDAENRKQLRNSTMSGTTTSAGPDESSVLRLQSLVRQNSASEQVRNKQQQK